jgi:hypothetical protein
MERAGRPNGDVGRAGQSRGFAGMKGKAVPAPPHQTSCEPERKPFRLFLFSTNTVTVTGKKFH